MKKETKTMTIVFIIVMLIVRIIWVWFDRHINLYGDELRYYGIARSLFMGTGLSIRNAPIDYQKILYSLFLAPFFVISDPEKRMLAIGFANTIVMYSGIIPVYLISKKVGLKEKSTCLLMVISAIWPELMISMSFMSEVIYYPLALWFVYLWLIQRDKKSVLLAIVLGIFCYIGYVCKEIFLAFLIADILFLLVSRSREKKEYVMTMLLIVAFALCHVILKVTAFKGLGNSYNQMGIEAILSVRSLLYLGYYFIYYYGAFFLEVLVLPVLYSAFEYNRMNDGNKALFKYVMLFSFVAVGTVAYTIMVREDIGRMVPRLHLRYMEPATILLIVPFFNILDYEGTDEKTEKNKWLTVAFICFMIFTLFVFRGAYRSVPVDQYNLDWYTETRTFIRRIFPEIKHFSIDVAGIFMSLLFCLFGITVHYIYHKKSKLFAKKILVGMLIFTSVVSCIYGLRWNRRFYKADRDSVEKVLDLQSFLKSDDECKSVLYITHELGIVSFVKYMDSYFDEVELLYVVDEEDLIPEVIDDEYVISAKDSHLMEATYKGKYEAPEEFSYIIVENDCKRKDAVLQNVERVDEISTDEYVVYKNLDKERITWVAAQ